MRSSTDIIIPGSIDLGVIFTDLGRVSGERLLLMLSYLYAVGQWRWDWKDARIEIHSSTLELLGGKPPSKSGNIEKEREGGEKQSTSGYKNLLMYAERRGIIERDDSYRVDHYSKAIRFVDRDINFRSQKIYTLTAKNAIKAYTYHREHSRQKFSAKSPIHAKILRSVDGLEYDGPRAWSFITNTRDKEDRAVFIRYHEAIELDWFTPFATDEQGRVYTRPVNMPRELRQFLTWEGRDLHQLDISHSQPLLARMLYYEDDIIAPEVERYRSLCESAQLYDFLNSKLQEPFDLNDPEVKRQFKTDAFGGVFYSHPKSKNSQSSELNRVMHQEFPVLAHIFNQLKAKDHSGLAVGLQAVEAQIIMDGVVDELKDEAFPLVTIHDAILTTADGVGKVRERLQATFQRLGLNPTIKHTIVTRQNVSD